MNHIRLKSLRTIHERVEVVSTCEPRGPNYRTVNSCAGIVTQLYLESR